MAKRIKSITRKKGSKRIRLAVKQRWATRNKMAVIPRNRVTMGKGFPKQLCITHKYHEQVYLTSTSGVLNSYRFACNGMYDPNTTGTGHQPMLFDQLDVLYDHYVVIGAKCTFLYTFSVAGTNPLRVVCFIDDNSTSTGSTIEQLAEYGQSGSVDVLAVGNNKVGKRTLKWSAKKAFGKNFMGKDSLQGTTAANPTELQHFTIGFQSDGISTQTLSIHCSIEYIAVWQELKEIAQS